MEELPVAHPLLLELEQFSRKEGVPAIPREVGRLLWTLVQCMQANRILEIGTAYGLATLWMALAQPPLGRIWTFDPDFERTAVALSYFQRAGEDDYIEIVNQPAMEILPIFPQRNMDIVFIDATPAVFPQYLEYSLPLLKLSGLIIFNGLLETPNEEFNDLFLNHEELASTILPIGAGVGLGARKE